MPAGSSPIAVDGNLDAAYGSPLAYDQTPTSAGDATTVAANQGYANGSELDAVYGVVQNNTLYLFFAGNLGNSDNLDLFIQTGAGGVNMLANQTLGGGNPGGYQRLAKLGSNRGLVFDSSFAPNYFLTASSPGGSATDTSNQDFNSYVNYANLNTGTYGYLGYGNPGPPGKFNTNQNGNALGMAYGFNNSNIAGVTATSVPSQSALASVATGLEFSIPIADLTESGQTVTSIQITAFLADQHQDLIYNQLTGLAPGYTDLNGNANSSTTSLGDPTYAVATNFNNDIPGPHYVSISTSQAPPFPVTKSGSTLLVNENGNGPITLSASGSSIIASQGTTTMTFSGISGATVTGSSASNVLNLSSAPAIPFTFTNAATTTLNVTSGNLYFASGQATIALGAMNISGGASAVVPAISTTQTQLVLNQLTDAGKLDLTNNVLLINYASLSDPIAAIQQDVVGGYNSGAWNGAGIDSSQAAANTGYDLGYADSADPGNPASLGLNQIKVTYTLAGDANLDEKVNGADFAILSTNFNQAVAGWDAGDFNYDFKANGADFAMLAGNFNKGVTFSAPLPGNAVSGVNFKYYEGTFSSLPNFSTLTPVKTGLTSNFNLDIRNVDQNFAFDYTGYLYIPNSGSYTFLTTSDNGSDLYIDGALIVNNDGVHSSQQAQGSTTLSAGYHNIEVSYFQQSGIPNLQVQYSGPGIVQQAIPTAALYGIAPATIDVSQYGAVGNGTHDDTAAFNAAIAAAPDYSTIQLDAGKTYLLSNGLLLTRPINIEGNGATILFNTAGNGSPNSEVIEARSGVDTTTVTLPSQTFAVGQTSYSGSFSTSEFIPGDYVYLQLGTDPNDPGQPNYATIAQVVSNTGSVLTVNTAIPNMPGLVNGQLNLSDSGYTPQPSTIQRITDLIQNVSFKDLNYTFASGTTPDADLWIERADNVTASDITGSLTIGVNVADSINVTLNNIDGTLVKLDSSGGRAVSAYQSDGLVVNGITVNQSSDSPVVFLETWARNTTLNNIVDTWNYSSASSSAVFFFTGNSYNTFVSSASITNVGAINLAGSGGAPAQYSFGTATVSGPIKSALLSQTNPGTGQPVSDIQMLQNTSTNTTLNASSLETTATQTIALTSNMNYRSFNLLNGAQNVNGIISSIIIDASSTSGLSNLYINSASGGSANLTGNLTAGQAVPITEFFGTDYPWNIANQKSLVITTGNVPANTTLTVSVTYYPT